MICKNTFSDFSLAYVETLSDILKFGKEIPPVDNPLSPARHYGKKASSPTIELLNYSFTVNNPYSSLFYSENRIISLPYAVGLLIWSLCGSDEAEWLSYYHPNVKAIFPETSHMSGAFGKRMFNFRGRINQVNSVVEKLKQHPTTRRTTVMISEPDDHNYNNFEFPCALASQYFIRDNKLHSITYMRAQSAMAVLPYDVFLFMNIQIYVACKLGVEVGTYTHNAGTIHIYKDELQKVNEIIDDKISSVNICPVKNIDSSLSDYENLFAIEKELRANNEFSQIKNSDNYFGNLIEILQLYKFFKSNDEKYLEEGSIFQKFISKLR